MQNFRCVNYNPVLYSIRQVRNDNAQNTSSQFGLTQDVFQPTMSKEDVARKKFDTLFPNGEINKIYNTINKDFKINNSASLDFVYDETSQRGGGYNFNKNNIEMNLYDLVSSNKKIVGIKDGKKVPLVSEAEHLPLYVDAKSAKEFVKAQQKNGNAGYDKLIIEDVTPEEQRKFIIQKIAHECVHAKQHEVLRQTEGISDKDIIKAWTHQKPKNLAEKFKQDYQVNQIYNQSAWADTKQPQKIYSKDSEMGKYAQNLMNAIKNYPPVTSQEYKTNALEKEAFDISYDYVNSHKF